MISINRIKLSQHPEIQKEFTKRIKTVLQKLGTSNKTRALHNLADRELLFLGYGILDVSKERSVPYGSASLKETKLFGLTAEISAASNDMKKVSDNLQKIDNAQKELTRIKTTITDTSTIQINTLEKNTKEWFQEIIDNIDYFSLVDVYYYLYVDALAIVGLEGKGRNKVFESVYNVFREIFNNIMRNLHVEHDKGGAEKRDIILDYIFMRKFTDINASIALAKLSRMYGQDKVQFLIDLKPSEYTSISNIAVLLTKADIVNITESALMQNIRAALGAGIDDVLKGTFDELVAYIISTNYKSTLFKASQISKPDVDRLEELVLNFKREIILPK